MHSRKKLTLLVIGGSTCFIVFILLSVLFHRDRIANSASTFQTVNPSPIAIGSPDDRENNSDLVREPPVPPDQSQPEKKEHLAPPPPPPPLDKAAIEFHRTVAASFTAELRERTKRLYGLAFQQLGLPANLQEKVIDILTQQQQQLEQQAFEAAQSGKLPDLPSPEEMRTQQVQQDNQLRLVLGDAGFAQFKQYQATIPDRIIISQMSEQGANLSESQAQKLLQILTASREQIFGQAGVAPNLNSMSPDQAMAATQQQQALLQQTVSDRVQSLLAPEQAKTLQGVISKLSPQPQ